MEENLIAFVALIKTRWEELKGEKREQLDSLRKWNLEYRRKD